MSDRMKETPGDDTQVKEKHVSTLLTSDGKEHPDDNHGCQTPNPVSSSLLYKVDEVPPPGILISVALQNVLLGVGGNLTTAYFISDVICAEPAHPIRAKLFCTSLFMTGLCTTLMSLVGVRLPIFQSVCSTFLVPLMAMRAAGKWTCDNLPGSGQNASLPLDINQTTESATQKDEDMYIKLREMMGCLLLSSLFEVFVGVTGLVGFLLRYIGPITISTVVSLIGLSLYKIPMEYARTHWGVTAVCIVLAAAFMMYLDRFAIPFPTGCQKKKGTPRMMKLPVLQMFPVILSILFTWLLCGILTTANVLSDDPKSLQYRARTDMRVSIIYDTPWFYFPYPGQFGPPLFNTTIFMGFLVAVISSVLETIGDYHACAHLCHAPPPPPHAVNRGVLLEGIGSVISGAMGAGHATTSSTANLVLVNISKVASRSGLTATGIICIFLSIIGKFGAVLSTMPDPCIGGAMFIAFGMLSAIGIFTLKAIDLSSSRNLAIFGLSLYCGIVIPEWVERYPAAVESGNETVDGIVKGLLGNSMFLGGLVAFVLDNTVRGTLRERGFFTADSDGVKNKYEHDEYLTTESEAYSLPYVETCIKHLPFLRHLPFIQSVNVRKADGDIGLAIINSYSENR